jgi:hypothetical protein
MASIVLFETEEHRSWPPGQQLDGSGHQPAAVGRL